MIVCICHGVSDRDLKDLIASGATSLREIGQSCRAGTDCGACLREIRQLAQQQRVRARKAHP